MQDRTGYIWLGTSFGLYRFDGTTFHSVAVGNTDQDLRITALAEDSLNRIWVGSGSGKIGWIENGNYNLFQPEEGLSAKPVSDLIFDTRGNLWFSTLEDGLYYFTRDRLYRIDEQEGLPDLYLYDLEAHSDGSVWAGSDGGLIRCALSGSTLSLKVFSQQNGLQDNIVKRIKFSDGRLFLATEDAGVLLMGEKGEFVPLVSGGWIYGSVSDIEVRHAKVWAAIQNRGLLAIDIAGGLIQQYRQEALNASTELMCDAEGNLWLGSRAGLARTPGNTVEFFLQNVNSPQNVVALAVTADNTMVRHRVGCAHVSPGLRVVNAPGARGALRTYGQCDQHVRRPAGVCVGWLVRLRPPPIRPAHSPDDEIDRRIEKWQRDAHQRLSGGPVDSYARWWFTPYPQGKQLFCDPLWSAGGAFFGLHLSGVCRQPRAYMVRH
jgi:sugar lactone lactonase YvrE